MQTLTTRFVLGPKWNGALMTPREFDAVQEWNENYRYELVNGVVVVSRIATAMETGPNDAFGRWLGNYKETHPQGSALDETLPQQYVYLRNSRRIADRLI